jgi:hypothetical protein
VNTTEVKFWLDWYEQLDEALAHGEGSVVAYVAPDGDVHHAVEQDLLPVLHEIRDLFRVAGKVEVFCPRAPEGVQVWPVDRGDPDAAQALARLVEEPAYVAQDHGFRVHEPDAPNGLLRLIDLLELREFCDVLSPEATARCPAWSRILPELVQDGLRKVVAEALAAFDLMREDVVREVLAKIAAPIETLSPFLVYVSRPLSLSRLVREERLVRGGHRAGAAADDPPAGDRSAAHRGGEEPPAAAASSHWTLNHARGSVHTRRTASRAPAARAAKPARLYL